MDGDLEPLRRGLTLDDGCLLYTSKAPGNWSLFAIETQRPCEGDMILLVDKIEKSFGARTLFTLSLIHIW